MTTIRLFAPAILFASFGLAQTPAPSTVTPGAMQLRNAPLDLVIDALARELRIDYVLDPAVTAGVSITTYGDGDFADTREVLNVILRGSHAKMVAGAGDGQVRIVQQVPKSAKRDRRTVNLVFLENMAPDRIAELVLSLAGPEPAEIIRSASSNLLVMSIRTRPLQ